MRKLLLLGVVCGAFALTSCMQWFGDAMDQWFPQRLTGDAGQDEE